MGRRPIVQGRAIDVTTSTSPLVGQHANCTVTDQTTKIKGMFVRPEQIAEIGKPHPELGRLRLVVTRAGETDVMTLKVECSSPSDVFRDEVASTLRAVTKLQGAVELVPSGTLPNDGKVIVDQR